MRRSRNFRQGGSRSVSKKKKINSDNVFFLVLSLFYRSQWSISKKSIIFQGSRGGPTFSRGVQLFPGGGSNCLFPIEAHITCDFPRGSGPPVPPLLDPHLKWYQIQIHSLSIHSSDQFCLTRRSDRKSTPKQLHPQYTDISSRLCILETSQFRQEQSQQFVFMVAQCSSVSEYVQ